MTSHRNGADSSSIRQSVGEANNLTVPRVRIHTTRYGYDTNTTRPSSRGKGKASRSSVSSLLYVCVFFTLNRYFCPSTSTTTTVRDESSILERCEFCGRWSQNYATETLQLAE